MGYYYPLEFTKEIENIMPFRSHWKKRIEESK